MKTYIGHREWVRMVKVSPDGMFRLVGGSNLLIDSNTGVYHFVHAQVPYWLAVQMTR